ncbi:MAG: Ig-like domain-containing protein [Actinomycetota bacterium]|nr:Ig-like domain-containing protein [Actinomycetota bacterium]
MLLATGLAAVAVTSAQAAPGPVGNGFTVTAGDLSFILKQIKIAEAHAATLTPANPCGTLVGPGPNQIPDALTAYGLRTVDGSCNNLLPGREKFAAADVPFPRLTNPVFRAAEGRPADFFGPGDPGSASSSYAQKKGSVFDSQPRVISNLIVDQTSTNPAAIAAAHSPVRSQDHTPSAVPCTTDPVGPTPGPAAPGIPAGCTPAHQTLFIPNVTTDVGLSPPYNSLFTFFGQFFDHGVDQTVKSGGTVFVPLQADDPLIAGPDHIFGNADDLPTSLRFMVLTRAQNQPGPDGILGDDPATPAVDESADDIQNANNTDSPWVDQSQTYTSHASHQVFLREYVMNSSNAPVSTGKLLGGLPAGQTYLNSPDGTDGIGTWAAVKKQAAEKLGLKLVDTDVTNIPMLAADPYGKFIPAANGLPQYVTKTGLVAGNLANPVPVPANVLHFDTPFLTDIAHNADPGTVGPCSTTGNAAGCLEPDADNTPSADFASQPAGTYDDEMLNAHFSCGDGRCNENIALSTIHQIFHSEHDRLVDDIKNTLLTDASATGTAALPEWQLPTATNPAGWNGERLFQAARYVTEMEYQHLVFEEFARKVQPAVRPFHVYSPDINPAIKAEFAHAVYRFGHSMLDDTVARTNIDGSDNSLPLLDAFLNPPAFFSGGSAGVLTPQQAAGSVVMGSSDQTGNELDEFVTETLRNNLLGLPLDLPVLNMARARDAGVPPLNEVRRQIFAQTNDGQLAPYTSWSDFGQHLKHPESLINFVAAYGLHPSITSETTLAGKRAAATAIVNPDPNATTPIPADAAAFMFSTGAWASDANGVTNTGLDNVDLWMGGLAEVTNLFGGLLGSTFNYVFQNQLENLQDGDRLYYLNRTQGMNLRTQLEGNSFAELIQRNTDGTNTLKADAFATADCKFQLGNITGPYSGGTTLSQSATPPLAPLTGAGTVNDDPSTTNCDENQLLLQQPDGTIQYRQFNNINPSGINGQSVYQGTNGNDKVFGGNDNDTFWGGLGNDRIEGNGGDDVALGGLGNDIITDLSGADVLKGGPGNDAIDGGIGNDILLGGDGSDFINGGANDNETFAGPGNDYIIAGQGADTVFGDGGDDWIQGGTGQDLLQGDHGAPFFDDPAEPAPGNDIFIGQPGENDYDAEGGDDIMAQNAAIDRNAGAGGFDWAIHQYNTVPAVDDMMINNNLGGLPIQIVVNRDRWQETEADSGGSFNDNIKGTDGVLSTPRLIGGGGFTGCDALDHAGVARITGLADLLPPESAWLGTAAETASLSASKFCPLTGKVWGEGDILLGGPGNDTFTGRTGDEVIDGDKELRVAISVTDGAGHELGRTDLMEHAATSGNFGPGSTPTMTLQAAVFAGIVDPGNLVNVREIVNQVTAPGNCSVAVPVNCDTSVYTGPRSQYTITSNANGSTTVVDTTTVTPAVAGVVVKGDGTDTLWNVERLQFLGDTPNTFVLLGVPSAPTNVTALRGNASATVSWTAPASIGGSPISSYTIDIRNGTTVVGNVTGLAPTPTSTVVSGLANGTAYNFVVRALNAAGASVDSVPSNTVVPATTPSAPTIGAVNPASGQATVNWTAPASNGGAPITGYEVRVVDASNLQVGGLRPAGAAATNLVVTGLTNGNAYRFQVHALNVVGAGPYSALSAAVTPAAVDVTPPTVTARTPAINAAGVLQATNVTATFSEAVQPATVTGTSVTLRVGTLATGALVPAVVTYNATTRVVTLNPNANLALGTTYTVRLTNAIRDLAGNPLAAVTWSFTTITALVITARTPAANAVNVSRTANITFTTNRAILPATFVAGRVRLVRTLTGTVVSAVVSLSGTTVTINPNASLLALQQYRVDVLAGLTDAAGVPLAATAWLFRAA